MSTGKKQVWNCRGCNVGGDVIALVEHLDRCDFAAAVLTLTGSDAARKTAPFRPAKRGHGEDNRNLDFANAIWNAALPLGPEAIGYFASRGIDIDQVPDHGGLRFHARCPWQGGTKPCVVGRLTSALGNEPRGIWRRPISGEKPTTLGPMAGCVIRLWPDEAVEQGLVIGEGVETVLTAATRMEHRGTLLRPAWAACTAGNLQNFPVLPGIEALTVLVDNDASGAGQKAAAACATRWVMAGREVTRLTPRTSGADFNDLAAVVP